MMTESHIAHTDLKDSTAAGHFLGEEIRRAFYDKPADAVIVFSSAEHQYTDILHALKNSCEANALVGCSSAGEFTNQSLKTGSTCALALRSSDLMFTAALGRSVSTNRTAVAHDLASAFRGKATHDHPYRYALVLTDALAGHADEFIEQLTLATGGTYQLFGGGAGDDALFRQTHVFCDTEAATDAVVGLEILSKKPLGLGLCHGWIPASPTMRVTESQGAILQSINAVPAVEAFRQHARATNQRFDEAEPQHYFLHNIIGIDTGSGHKLRVPLTLHADGSITMAAEVPSASLINFMKTSVASATEAAVKATEMAVEGLKGSRPQAGLFFDCVATRLRMGKDFGFELDSISRQLGHAQYIGCNTYGKSPESKGNSRGSIIVQRSSVCFLNNHAARAAHTPCCLGAHRDASPGGR
ncbi:MAG: FIST C-terminal domain-containing protein [Nitrospirota bacterium]|nr:FIST C-terminal domain-containing protein [Nitrospirota bacterium]